MAVTAHEVIARQTAVLLRCQEVREQRRRRDALRADLDSAAAVAAVAEAREAVEAGRLADDERLRRAYDDFGGRQVRVEDLASLPKLRATLARDAQERDAAVDRASEAARAAQDAATAARAALLVESRATEKRSKLAKRSQALWRRTLDAEEEAERDDQVADTWRGA